jgi:putative membrane protein
MELFHAQPIVNSILYSFLGIVILLIGYYIIEKLTPEKTWKEVVEKNNVAVAIVLAAFIIGISMIISAAIHG